MNCSQAQDHFSAYIEGFLEPDHEEALQAHINECPECSQRVRELRRTIELLDDAYAGLAVDSKEVAPRVAGRAAENARRPKMARRTGIAGLWKVAAALIIAAGAVSIFMMSKTHPPQAKPEQPQAPSVAAAPERVIERTGIARVEVRRGAVGLRPALGARWSLAREDADIEPNDFIRVGDDALSCARVNVADGVAISMNGSSMVQFVAKNHVQVLAGDAHFSVATGTPFTVDTPLGTISVKGTTFDVSVQPGETSVAVWQGVVEVAAHDKLVEVSAGDMCVVTTKELTTAAAPAGTPWLAKLEDLPADETVGRLVATIDGKEVPLSVKSHRVTVTIRDQIAYTLIDEEFQNHTGSRLEGTFYYPLPADASISRFAMYIGDTLMEGEVVERMRAREVYESIVRRKRDPALLEWMGGNQFKARIFPIEPHSTKRVFIGYTQVLPRVDNVVTYTYPLKSEKLTKNPLSSLHIEVDAYSTPAIAAFDSPTHNCRIEADDHHGRATFSAADYIPTRDFVVSYTVTGEDAELYTVPHWRDDEGGYFLAFISPRTAPEAAESGAEEPPANVLLMVDTSASMAGDNFATAKRIASTYLNFLGDKDRFNILLYDVEPRLVFPEFVDNLVEFRRLAADKIAEVDPFGAGDLGRAIPAAADALREAQEARAGQAKILYIGDGVATIGETEPAKLLDAATAAFADTPVTVSTLAIGSEYDQAFIGGFARRFDGFSKVVSSARPVEDVVAEMVADSFKPVLTDLVLRFEGVEVKDVYPRVLPNVLVGGQVIVAGRYPQAGEGKLILTAVSGGELYRREIDVAFPEEKGPSTFVPRLWARRCMDDMLLRIGRGEGELAADVIDLSLKYKIMSPYTSFLVLETEEDYRRFGIDRRFSMEQWAGAPREAEGGWKAERSQELGEPTLTWGGPQGGGGRDFYLGINGEGGMDFADSISLDWIGDDKAFDINGRFFNRLVASDALALPGPMAFERSKRLMAFNAPMSTPAVSRLRWADFASRKPKRPPGQAWGPAPSLARRRGRGRRAGQIPGGPGRSGRLNRSGALYPQMHIPGEQPEPKVPEVDPEVRKAIGAFAQGPIDFQLTRKTTYYDKDGKTTSESAKECVLVGRKFIRENRRRGEITSRSLSDGERYYQCYEKKNYAAARKLQAQDYKNLRYQLPGMSGYTVDEFLVTYGPGKIESCEGDTTVLVVERGNSRTRFFVDTDRKVLTRMEHHYRQNKQSEFELRFSDVYDNHKLVAGRLIPTRVRHYNADGKLTFERTIEKLQVGEIAGDFTFTPPKGMLVATWPLPSVADAAKAAEDAKDSAQANFVLALALEQAGKHKQAAAAVDKIIEHPPKDVRLLLYRGWLQAASGGPDPLYKAAEQADKIVWPNREPIVSAEAPERARKRRYGLYQTLNNLLSRASLDRLRCVETLFELSEKGGSDRINWARQLADLHANGGAPEKGRDVLLKVIEDDPTSGNAWQQAAQFFQHKPQFADQAEEAFLKARELGYNIGAQLAQFYQNRGEIDKAEEEFKKARELGNDIGTQLAHLYQNNGELDKAIEEWREYFKKNISESQFRNFLQNIANERGPEAAAEEAEAIIADQKEPDRRKNAMRGYFHFARDQYWSEKVLTISKQLHEAWPEDDRVLRDLMEGHRSYYSPYDPFPGIREFLAAPPKDHQDLIKKLRVTRDLASHGHKQEAAELLAKLAEHGLEMDTNQEAEYLKRLADVQQNIEPADAVATWRRILELDLPADDHRMRQARYSILQAAINNGDTQAARKGFVETVKHDREQYNLDSMWRTLTNILYKEKKYDELVALNTELQALMPDRAYFHRLQIASVRAAQEKTQEACDLLWPILHDTDAAIRAAGEEDTAVLEKDEPYYFYQAGRMLIRVTAKDDDLKAKLDEETAARAGAEKPDGDLRWTELHLDLLRARGSFKEMTSLLEKLAGRETEDDWWQWQLAAVYAATREYAKAESIYKKLLEKEPSDPSVLMQLSRLAGAMKKPDEAKEYWDKWLDALPDEEYKLRQIAQQLAQRGDSPRAIAVYEKLQGFARRPGNYINELAAEYQKLDRKLDAAMAYVRATRPAPNRNRRPYDRFDSIWPLVMEEGAFNKFAAGLEQEIAQAKEPSRRARLSVLMADIHTKKGDKETAGRWAQKAIAEAAELDKDALDAALAALKAARQPADVLATLRGAVKGAGDKAPDWLRFTVARHLFALGRAGEGEKAFREVMDTLKPSARHEKMLELAELVFEHPPAPKTNVTGRIVPAEKTYEPHASALVEEVIRDGRSRLAAKALRLKADLMARSQKYAAADVIKAFHAAATTGPQNERREAAEAMRGFAEGAKEHDAVLEAYKLLCRSNRGNVRTYIEQIRKYLYKHDLKDRTEAAMRELVEFARRDYNYASAWRSFGECFRSDDPQKAVEIWAEGISRSREAYRSRYARNDLIQRICSAMLHEPNKEKISRDFVAKVLLDEMDVRLGGTRHAGYGWPSYFWEAVGKLDLTDKMTAKLNAVPEGQEKLGNTYRTIGDAYRRHLHKPDTALKYYAMALEASALSGRNHVLNQVITIHKAKKNWQEALDTVRTIMKSNRNSYHYKMQEGYFLAKLGQRDEALESYEKASQLAGRRRHDYDNHRIIGESALEAGLYDFAIDESTLALRVHDYYRQSDNRRDIRRLVRACFLNIAKCHEKKGENEKAIDALLTGASRIGEESYRRELYDELKRIIRDGGRFDEFVADYERNAKETRTEKPALRMIFGDVARDKNDHDQALRHYRAALEVAPNNADVRKRVTETLRKANRTDELIAHYRDWTRYDSKNVQHYSEMGRLLKKAGRNAEAMRAYTTMLEAMPTEAESHRRMANIYTNTNRHGDAVGMWKRVVKFRPEEPQSHYGLAQSYTRNNQRDLAAGVYEKMLEATWDRRFGDVHRKAKKRLARLQAQ